MDIKSQEWAQNIVNLVSFAGVAGPDKGSATPVGGHEDGEVKGELRLYQIVLTKYHLNKVRARLREHEESRNLAIAFETYGPFLEICFYAV